LKKLDEILESITVLNDIQISDQDVSGVYIDSRECTPKCMFIAYKGVHQDGHDYITSAISNGAQFILLDNESYVDDKATYILVGNARDVVSKIAANYYEHPTEFLTVVGVTGTNGKTTTTNLLNDLFFRLSFNCGLISTIEVKFGNTVTPSKLTTPDAISLQRLFREMKDAGITHVFMEASSHAIHQGRVDDVHFDHVVFTNITHDHLDYHRTFLDYIKAKKLLFDKLPASATALINVDDTNGPVMVQNSKADVHTYALRRPSNFKGKIISNEISGLHMDMAGTEVFLKIVGGFNAYNALAAYSTAIILGLDSHDVLRELSMITTAEGRFDIVRSENVGYTAVVDYAHTPDALENVLKTLVEIKKNDSRILTVVGCGGDRDKAKRPLMAKVAVRYSDVIILTSDNPRSEEPEDILDDMYSGLDNQTSKNVLRLSNRKEAIRTASMMANKGDTILIAGKGHEKYQEIKGEKVPFDDKKIIKHLMDAI